MKISSVALCTLSALTLGVAAVPAVQAGPICEVTVRNQFSEVRPLLDRMTYVFKQLDLEGMQQIERQLEAMDDRQDMQLRRRGCLTPAGKLINVSQATKQAQVSEIKGYLDRWVSILRGHGMTQYEINAMVREAKQDTRAFYGFAW